MITPTNIDECRVLSPAPVDVGDAVAATTQDGGVRAPSCRIQSAASRNGARVHDAPPGFGCNRHSAARNSEFGLAPGSTATTSRNASSMSTLSLRAHTALRSWVCGECLDAVDEHRPALGSQLLYRPHGIEQHEVEMVVLARLVDEANIEVFHAGGQVRVFDPAQRHDRVHFLGQLPQSGDAADPHLVVVGMRDGFAGLGNPP